MNHITLQPWRLQWNVKDTIMGNKNRTTQIDDKPRNEGSSDKLRVGTPTADGESLRATISFTNQVGEWASELMREDGFDNFSAFVAHLIRDAKQSREAVALRKLEIRARLGGTEGETRPGESSTSRHKR